MASNVPSELPEYVLFLQKFENKIQARDKEKKNTHFPITPTFPTARNTPTPSPASTSTTTYPGPMDLSATRLGPLSEQERAKRIAEKRCLYCEGLDHIIKNCSLCSA